MGTLANETSELQHFLRRRLFLVSFFLLDDGRQNYKELSGKVDVCFIEANIVVPCLVLLLVNF